MPHYFEPDIYTLLLLLAGAIALLAAVVPVILRKRYISAPIVYLVLGAAGYFICGHPEIHPLDHLSEIQHVTEFVVLVALANAGLRIKEPFKWGTWRYAVRLLAITMPLTIVAAAFLGWQFMGFAPATALLFGALISPTDPVLASELQTSAPGEDDRSLSKLGLTAEAGINDGLAFPFTWLAIAVALHGTTDTTWITGWLLHDVLIKMTLGVGIGLLTGWGLYKIVFSISSKQDTMGRISRGILSLSLVLLPYALCEINGGYGFLAVFFAACIFSKYEKTQKHMHNLHDFNEELEAFAVAAIFVTTGIFIALHYELLLDLNILATALIMVLVVRPLMGWVSLAGSGLNSFQKFVLSFYGMRGIGSIFYLAFALQQADFAQPKKLIAVTTATIFFSVLIHGISARYVQKRIKKYDFKE